MFSFDADKEAKLSESEVHLQAFAMQPIAVHNRQDEYTSTRKLVCSRRDLKMDFAEQPPPITHYITKRAMLSGPVRDTPPYRAIPFRDSIAEGGIAPICLVFIGYRASIAEIPL